jgi:hypothetical protein
VASKEKDKDRDYLTERKEKGLIAARSKRQEAETKRETRKSQRGSKNRDDRSY